MDNIGYKVVHFNEITQQYKSCCAPSPIIYQIDEPTIRRDGPLTLFDNFTSALNFKSRIYYSLYSSYISYYKIFKASYKPSNDNSLWQIILIHRSIERRQYYKDEDFPEGTIFADEITLLEEIK